MQITVNSSPVLPSARERRGAFALVITLLILSLLIIVAVSYLTSMTAERQTADAYDAKASAEQAAQTGVDAATAMLAQSFRDFPDSATVWDTAQTTNSGTPYNAAIVNSSNNLNEGTSLYLRAIPSTQDATAAEPLPPNATYINGGTSYAANDPKGNDPNNPACENFVLPLISGVPNGRARLVSSRASIFPSAMKLDVSDASKQNWTDLNVRRVSGDIQGVIGSPPGWNGAGPKPARAYWVPLTGSNGLISGRYAFWIEDESFRLNTSVAGGPTSTSPTATPPTQPPDNTSRPLDPTTGKPRSLQSGDLTLVGTLAGAGDTSGKAPKIMAARAGYPGYFFPDPLAFSHAFDGTTGQTSLIDTVRYVTTNQSGALNLSRHGSQRLNLNTVIPPATTVPAGTMIQTQINQLVETMEYHLPYFGERFYRTSSSALNDATQVPGSPYAPPTGQSPYATNVDGTPKTDSSHSQIYYYKIAANLRDYVDTDSQPTMIGTGGVVMGPPGAPTLLATGSNEIWAQGKECTPYIQEVAVRYRTFVTPNADKQPFYNYSMQADYYIEFWNMSDHDISARQMRDSSGNGPTIWIKDQQTWCPYDDRDSMQPGGAGESFTANSPPADTQIDLLNSVQNRNVPTTDGVVFKAGAVTIVTSDPQFASYQYQELTAGGLEFGKTSNPTAIPSTTNVFLCPIISGSRLYTGIIKPLNPTLVTARSTGIRLGRTFESTVPFTGTEVSLMNSQGYFDVVRGAITKTGTAGKKVYIAPSDTDGKQGGWNDFSYGSSMMGNAADTAGGPLADTVTAASISQLGDPRTTNEQLAVTTAYTTADATRFMASRRTLGSPNYPAVVPDGANPWLDYYKFPGTATSPDYTTAPAVIAGAIPGDIVLTSVGQLGDIFDPARLSNPLVTPPATSILYSHGGGRTLKVGQHDDLYSDDPQTNAYPAGVTGGTTNDYVSTSNGWAAWRLTDIFDVADPIQLTGRININGIMRDNGAALLSALQGFAFQPKTLATTDPKYDPNIHGDVTSGLAGATLDTTGSTNGYSQIIKQMTQRLDAAALVASSLTVKPFFERGELSELGYSVANSNNNPLFSVGTALTGVNMGAVTDHSREEMFRRLTQMICTKGNTFTVYAVGQSVLQTSATGPVKITGTQRMRVTFRLVPKAKDTTGAWVDFHPGYTTSPTDGTITRINSIDPANATEQLTSSGQIGIVPRFAKPDRYDVQILQVASY